MDSLKTKLKTFYKSPWFVILVGSILGMIFFGYIYGFSCVNPLNINWLMFGGDLKQHFMGWQFFRNGSWSFPIGIIHSLAYPYGLPITYMDSIPLLAIPMKLISPFLPANFQYFGLYELFCYMAQGGISALLIRHFTKNRAVIILGSLFFILSPIMTMRSFMHTALSSHWLILLAILALLEWKRIASFHKQLLVWSILLVLAVLIHPYFVLMIGVLFVISLFISHKRLIETVAKLIFVPLISIIVFWIIGGFQIGQVTNDGLGYYALNLNSLYNPMGWSHFISPITNLSLSGETMNYLGLGVILLVPTIAIIFIYKFALKKQILHFKSVCDKKCIIPFLIILCLILLSISPKVQFGSSVLLNLKLPAFIVKPWSIFRASARLFWPVYYLILLSLLVTSMKLLKKNQFALITVLSILLVIQFVDIGFSPNFIDKKNDFQVNRTQQYKSPLNLDTWKLQSAGRKNMIYLDGMSGNVFFKLVDVADMNKLTMNTGYYARSPGNLIYEYQVKMRNDLMIGRADVVSNLFITNDTEFIKAIRLRGKYEILVLDGFSIIK
jgi:hypothetical protein